MTGTQPPNDASEPNNQSWSAPTSPDPWASPEQPAQGYPPPQQPGYDASGHQPAQQGYPQQPGYPTEQGFQPAQGYQPAPGFEQGYPPGAPGQGFPSGPGYPQQYGGPGQYPYPPSANRGYDWCSIVALILGVIAFVPFAIGFGIAGLVRTRGKVRRGRWMAVVGIIAALAWVAGIITLVAVGGNKDAHRSASGQVTKDSNISPYNVRVGDCIKLPSTTGNITTLPVVPCSEPHNAQAFADVTIPGSSYPGSSATLQTSLDLCRPEAVTFLGSGSKTLTLAALYPSSVRWALGNHTSHCLLLDQSKDITGDIRQDK